MDATSGMVAGAHGDRALRILRHNRILERLRPPAVLHLIARQLEEAGMRPVFVLTPLNEALVREVRDGAPC